MKTSYDLVLTFRDVHNEHHYDMSALDATAMLLDSVNRGLSAFTLSADVADKSGNSCTASTTCGVGELVHDRIGRRIFVNQGGAVLENYDSTRVSYALDINFKQFSSVKKHRINGISDLFKHTVALSRLGLMQAGRTK